MMEIRPTEIKDLPLVMEIYDYARLYACNREYYPVD